MGGIQNRALHRAAVLLLAALGLTLACTTERGIQPEPEQYRLYVGMEGDGDLVFAVDVANDSVVDSTAPRIFTASIPLATPDGKYVLVQRVSEPSEVFNAADLSLITELPGGAYYITLALEEDLILGVRDSCISYVSYPDFGLVRTDTVRIEGNPLLLDPLEVDIQRGLLYAFVIIRPQLYEYRFELLAWDYRNHEVHERWDFADAFPERAISISSFTLSPDRSRVYVFAGSRDGAVLFCYALAERQLIWETSVLTAFGYLRFTPDGKELWRTDRGLVEWPIISGYIFTHDPVSGAVTDSISMFGYAHNPSKPLPGREIVFAPDGRKAYVAASDITYSTGPVFVIDARKHEITDLLFDDFQHLPYWLSIGPAP
ncbi:MAG TPA: hypothetical protein VM118_13725 [Acidobacteriota bacterium]|nr:hypothetical protein [Acidobacteriota bacterium]